MGMAPATPLRVVLCAPQGFAAAIPIAIIPEGDVGPALGPGVGQM